ncbi:MAG TPA: TonB-dependent receptor, partial [Bacteroidales bacterium]|nr:TonB-dependent receptor [Bacteroidales bacterium]
SAGAYGLLSGSLGHYNKVGDKFGYSLSANYLHRDGYYLNSYMDEQVDKVHSFGARNKLTWRPDSRLEITNIVSMENSYEGGYPYAMLNDSLQAADDINYNQPSSYNRMLFSDAFLMRYNTENFEIQSTTAYQFLDDQQNIDQDFTYDSLYFVVQEQQQHMISQELILRSPKNKRYSWLFGAYGFMQRFNKHVDVDIYQRNMTVFKKYDKTIGGAALFHQSTYNDFLFNNLSLTAGIRLDFEKNVLDYIYDIDVAGTFMPQTDTIYPDLSYTEILPKVALNYKFNRSSIYAVVAKGYKTGGFNSTFYKDEDLFFNPEYSWSYEIGTKSVLFGNTLYADLSLFYIDWQNQQIYQPAFYRDNTPAPGSLLKNAGRSASKGGEITLKSIPIYGFSPTFSYGFTHATFTEHMVDDATDYSGNFIPYVPMHTVNAQVKKNIYLKNNNFIDKIEMIMMYRGVGDIWWNEENFYKTDYYSLLNAKIGFSRGKLAFELWGKNLLAADYQAFYFQAIGNQYIQSGKPLHFGMNLKYEF